jgi:hypothetical protein
MIGYLYVTVISLQFISLTNIRSLGVYNTLIMVPLFCSTRAKWYFSYEFRYELLSV